MVTLGTGIGLASVWLGLVVSAMFNLPPSFCIVSLSFLAWIVTLAVTRRGRRARVRHQHGDHHHAAPASLSV